MTGKMASAAAARSVAEQKNSCYGTEEKRKLEDQNDEKGQNAVDDELAILMPSLTKRFQAVIDDEISQTPNLMPEQDVDKENVDVNRDPVRVWKRRENRQVDKMFAGNGAKAASQSGSLYSNINSALKENMNKPSLLSQIVDDFWSTEKQKKISAIARRKLTGTQTPLQSKQQIKDKETRPARSRSRGGKERKLGDEPSNFDLYNEYFKNLDQEPLAVEEEGDFLGASSLKPCLEANLLDREGTFAFPAGLNGAIAQQVELQDEETLLQREIISFPAFQHPHSADSNSSLLEMDISSSDNRWTDELEFLTGEGLSQQPLHDAVEEIERLADFTGAEAPGQSFLTRHLSGSIEDLQGHDGDLAHGAFPEAPLSALDKGSPVPSKSCQVTRPAINSPSPSSNPVAAYNRQSAFLSRSCLKGETEHCSQRKLLFLSSFSSENMETGTNQKASKNDIGGLYHGGTPKMPATTDNEVKDLPFNEESLPVQSCDGVRPHADNEFEVRTSMHANQAEATVPTSSVGHKGLIAGVGIERDTELLTEQHLDDAEKEMDRPPQNSAFCESLISREGNQVQQSRVKRKLETNQRRNSLEGCGSVWRDGHRCSQRRRFRPLEWWRGEKLLYGRVHTTLCSVIGIKHSSPVKYALGMSDPFKVDSFVPAKYFQLVQYSAT